VNYHIRTEHERETALADLRAVKLPARVEIHAGTRTLTQNAALHRWLGLVAKALNEAGCDMKRTLRHDADISWTAASVKEYLWRPVQEAMTGKGSTADANRVEYGEVEQELSRHIAQRVGVTLPPWPKKGRGQ